MRCPTCGGARIVLAAVPGEQPGEVLVCLECAALWTGRPEEVAHRDDPHRERLRREA